MSRKRTALLGEAARKGAGLGHRFGPWEPDDGWTDALVSTCQSCDQIAAIDCGEEPYLFGAAFRRKCRG